MTFYKVKVSKEFIEEASSEFAAESGALVDMSYNLDREIHTPLSIRGYVNIKTMPLTEEEFKELGVVMND